MTLPNKDNNILNSVVASGYCIGCGICSAICPADHLKMAENEYGEYHPVPQNTCLTSCDLCLQVCPFSNQHGLDEDILGKELFSSDPQTMFHPTMGWVRDTFVGYKNPPEDRLKSASGGLATDVLCELLRAGKIDGAVVPMPLTKRPWFVPKIVHTEEEILASSGSVYHVLHFDEVLRDILAGPDKRYAIVALPCVAKAIRLGQKQNSKLRSRIRFILGLTCSGQRSMCWTDCLIGLAGGENGSIRYRSKTGAHRASEYRFENIEPTGKRVIHFLRFQGLFGFSWLNGMGALKSCLLCDDIFAELADASFMDAWLPEYVRDRGGTSLVVSRKRIISKAIFAIFDCGESHGETIDPSAIARSQKGVLKKKRSALAARVTAAGLQAEYVPNKRLDAYGVSSAEGNEALALGQLACQTQIRELLKNAPPYSASRRAKRIFYWQMCWKVRKVRRTHGLAVYKTTALLFFAWLPNPKAILVRIIRRLQSFFQR